MSASNNPALEVGSYFIAPYYQLLSETPEYSHQYYNDSSTMTRVDGDGVKTASTMLGIHSLLTSLNITKVEVTQLNAQNSWNGGVLLIVSGIVRSRNYYGKRKFTQAFFLAPQNKGFFVMNDVLQIQDEDVVIQHPEPELPDIPVESEVHAYNSHLEQTVPNYELEEETREYVNSLHINNDSPIDKYSLPDEQQDYHEEAAIHEFSPLETADNHEEEPIHSYAPAPAEEPIVEPAGERPKLSYASILQASKGQSSQLLVSRQHTARQSRRPPTPLEQRKQPSAQQLNASASSFVPEASVTGADDGLVQKEVELTSVYVRSLPLNVTNADLEKEFKNFGKIKPKGVFIRNKQDVGVCFAFVEFEDMSGVHNAINASPIELLGRRVYIEERRANSNNTSRGGAVARGRGRGRGGIRNPDRGNAFDGNNYNSARGNGFQQRAYQ
ncbi:nuclear transport factor 2-like [Silene latifolia]|uniref:nuclear transport factor 2-like n=1 Tax=Silene latifolia TaxID=37657 RepID=UPI003D76EE33